MQVFPRKTLSLIARQLEMYFRRQWDSAEHPAAPDAAITQFSSNNSQAWNKVFDSLLKHSENEALELIALEFKEGYCERDICDRLHINRATYYEHRRIILTRAGVIAVGMGVLRLSFLNAQKEA